MKIICHDPDVLVLQQTSPWPWIMVVAEVFGMGLTAWAYPEALHEPSPGWVIWGIFAAWIPLVCFAVPYEETLAFDRNARRMLRLRQCICHMGREELDFEQICSVEFRRAVLQRTAKVMMTLADGRQIPIAGEGANGKSQPVASAEIAALLQDAVKLGDFASQQPEAGELAASQEATDFVALTSQYLASPTRRRALFTRATIFLLAWAAMFVSAPGVRLHDGTPVWRPLVGIMAVTSWWCFRRFWMALIARAIIAIFRLCGAENSGQPGDTSGFPKNQQPA